MITNSATYSATVNSGNNGYPGVRKGRAASGCVRRNLNSATSTMASTEIATNAKY